MSNELILIISLVVIYLGVLIFYRLFGSSGLYCWTAIATVSANIEVAVLIDAFGMEQTLGNILFASTFVTTDILSEMEGKKAANKAVFMGIAVSAAFIVISQSWMLYTPNANDAVLTPMRDVFSSTPRILLAGISVYAVVQAFDVWAYHVIWKITEKKSGDRKKYLWLRNNAATLASQLLNTILFTLAAFAGTYDAGTILSIMFSSYVIYVVTSLLDTPVVYIARSFGNKKKLDKPA